PKSRSWSAAMAAMGRASRRAGAGGGRSASDVGDFGYLSRIGWIILSLPEKCSPAGSKRSSRLATTRSPPPPAHGLLGLPTHETYKEIEGSLTDSPQCGGRGSALNACARRSDDTDARKEARRCVGRSHAWR